MGSCTCKNIIYGFFLTACKVAISGFLAFIVLTILCIPYYSLPVHAKNIDKTTDYKWEPYSFYSRATEGFAWGRINNDGFSNNFDYTPEMPLDILMMGSSHMEAFNVAMDESTTAALNKLLGKNLAYNIGISGHDFLISTSNLKNAVERYKPSKFVVIETNNLTFSDADLEKTINDRLEKDDGQHSSFINLLQRIPYIRLLYAQFNNFMGKDADEVKASSIEVSNEQLIDALLNKITTAAGATKVIILYHPGMQLTANKSLKLFGSDEARKQFRELSKKHSIIFLDMSDDFVELYKKDFTLAYGFPNSAVGSGHLNKYGHAAIAERLYKLIKDEEV